MSLHSNGVVTEACVPPIPVHNSLRNHCNWDSEEEEFYEPTAGQILGYSVLVCTCFMGARLHNLGIKQGDYQIVIVDEAGDCLFGDMYCFMYVFIGVYSSD